MKIWDTIKNSKTGKYGFFVTGVDTQASLIVQGMLRYQEREVVISEAEIELSWACISMSAYSALFWGTRSKVSFFLWRDRSSWLNSADHQILSIYWREEKVMLDILGNIPNLAIHK